MADLSGLSPAAVRRLISEENLIIPTAGLCPGYIQANLVVLRKDYADEFRDFAMANPKPCPILEIIDGGSPISGKMAVGSDITREIPLYRVYEKGILKSECVSVDNLWETDMTAFLIGCSLTFEEALVKAGIRLRHYEENKRVPMYDTSIRCRETRRLRGNYVVSMRPVKRELVDLAVSVTENMVFAHGAPVHIGDPKTIGINDINSPDYGDPPAIGPDEVPVFWACGVTPQAVVRQSRPDLMISHSPGYMLITDVKCTDM